MATKKTDESLLNVNQKNSKPKVVRASNYHQSYVDNFRVSYSEADIKITMAVSEILSDGTQLLTETGVLIMTPMNASRLANVITLTCKSWQAQSEELFGLAESPEK
jgi:hypothetical protein